MNSFNSLLLLFLATSLLSCGNDSNGKSSNYSLDFGVEEAEFQLGDSLNISVISKNETPIDSVVFYLQDQKLGKAIGQENFEHVFGEEKLGQWELSAVIYSQGAQEQINKEFKLYNDAPPITYTYRIVATYPHAFDAYTQGLEFHNDTLYESTGQYGESTLRKTDFRTGEVLKSVALDDSYFGEGMTIMGDTLYLLTWKSGEGFLYDSNSLDRIGSFAYNQSKEGWGLTNDGEKLYKSDGTEKIWILDSETMAEEEYIQTASHTGIHTKWNELEWINGRIYANTYQKDGVAIINPENGAIEGLINFQGLRSELTNEVSLDPINDVLNGIAYNPKTKKLYVTGKNWDKLFEVEILEK